VSDQPFLDPVSIAEAVAAVRRLVRAKEEGAGRYWIEKYEKPAAQASDLLVRAHLRLVMKIARSYGRNGYIELADLVQEGNLALHQAVRRYAASHDDRGSFSAYAYGAIRGAIGRAIDTAGHAASVPDRVLIVARRTERLRRSLEQQGKVERRRLCELLDVSNEELLAIEQINARPLFLSAPLGEGATTVGDTLYYRDETDAVSIEVEGRDTPALLDRYLTQVLTKIELAIVRQRFNLDAPDAWLDDDGGQALARIASKFGISVDDVRRIRRRSLVAQRRDAMARSARGSIDPGTPTSFSAIATSIGISETATRRKYEAAITKLARIPEVQALASDPQRYACSRQPDDAESWYLTRMARERVTSWT
jgi:RNA polymerase sigma factor (sigma-70 family)